MRFHLSKAVQSLTTCLFLAAATGSALGATFSVGGKVSGLKAGESVTLVDNKVDKLVVNGNKSFTFKTKLATGAKYSVAVSVQPKGQICTIVGGTGTVGTKNITTVAVTCKNAFSIGGTITGLAKGKTITLADKLSATVTDTVTKTGTGASLTFSFPKLLTTTSKYAVSVKTQPAGEKCAVTGGAGTVGTKNVTTVSVKCTAVPPPTFSIGGSVSWPSSGVSGSVTLATNGESAPVTFPAKTFTFPTKLATGTTYNISVSKQPTGGTCTVTSGGSGKIGSSNITNVVVTCKATAPSTFSIGGSVSWPSSGVSGTVTLGTNSESVNVTFPNTSFTFPTKLATGTSYNITVTTQPTGGTCTVTTDASGKIGSANITDVVVTCTATAPAKFSIGGNVTWPSSGVSGTVTLGTNSESVNVTFPNTSFTFPTKLASGTHYSISVTTQPTGGTCSVTGDASGTIGSSNITDVAVTCTKTGGGGGGGAGAFWIPYTTRPLSKLAMGQTGSTGLFVIPSDKISSSPDPTWITTDLVHIYGIGIKIAITNETLSTYVPQVLMYSDTDSKGNITIQGLDLSSTAATPKPVQVSNLVVDSAHQICGESQGQVSLSDPTSIFLLLHTAPAGSGLCGQGSDVFEVVHYKDSASTAPVTVSLDTSSFDELYNNGTLSGLVVFDFNAGTVSLYGDDSFTSPTILFSGATDAYSVSTGVAKNHFSTESSELFYDVTTATTKSNPSGSTLYLISPTGTPTQIFQGPVGGAVSDDNNMYFVSTTGFTSSDTTTLYQVALTGGTPTTLYTGPATISAGMPATTQPLDYELIGSNDSLLIFSTEYGNLATGSSTTLYHVAVGSKTVTPTTIATYANAGVGAFLATPSSGKSSDDKLFVSIDAEAISKTGLTQSWSSIAFPAAGPYSGTPLPNSSYGDLGLLSTDVAGTAWRVKGITGTSGGFEGGTVYLTDVGTLTDTAVTTKGGGNYSFPALTGPSDTGYTGILLGLSSAGVAVGDFLNTSGDANGPNLGVAIDLSKDFLYPITVTNSDVDF